MRYAIRWFKCKLKPPKKNDCIWSFNSNADAVAGPKEACQGAAMGPSVHGSRRRGRGSRQYGHRSGSNRNYAEVVAKENASSRQAAVGSYSEMRLNGRLKVDVAGRDKEEGLRSTQTTYEQGEDEWATDSQVEASGID